MCKENNIECINYNLPYVNLPNSSCNNSYINSLQNMAYKWYRHCTRCVNGIPRGHEDMTQTAHDLKCLEIPLKTAAVHNESSNETENRIISQEDITKHIEDDSQMSVLPLTPEDVPALTYFEDNTLNTPPAKTPAVNQLMDAGDTVHTSGMSPDDKHIEDGGHKSVLPPMPEDVPLSVCFDDITHSISKVIDRLMDAGNIKSCDQPDHCGLLHFRKWWERIEVDISVFGKSITGIPIFIEENTLRVINNNYSYFIPINKIDYIRTTDGLRSGCHVSDKNSVK